MAERLVHYSSETFGSVYSKSQHAEHFKPEGLWVSVDSCASNWKDWCEQNDFHLESLAKPHDVFLSESANILRLNGENEIMAFTAEYTEEGRSSYRSINWKRVANEYDGIIIAPYCWSLRLDNRTFWYYSWDCASGCIWNASAIKSVVAVQTEVG